jgi:hypothetical protein
MIARERCHRVAPSRRDRATGKGGFGHDALKVARKRLQRVRYPDLARRYLDKAEQS